MSALPPKAAKIGRSALVESRIGAVAWAIWQRSVSHPRSSNRTCRFPASGSPTGFTVRHTARGTKVAVQGAAHAFPIDYVVGELMRPTPFDLVPSREEIAYALIDVVVDT